jgi:uncharacterized membrane protein YdbT with pleckstrin-like domain
VGFPEDILTDDEQVVQNLHPHWIRLVLPALGAVVILGLAVLAIFFVPNGSLQKPVQYVVLVLAIVGLVYVSVLPWLRWLTTHYVITTERVVLREGVLTRTGRDIPLIRINDVSFHHSVPERLLGSGTLTIESAGERGQVVLASVPQVEQVHLTLYELAEAMDMRRRGEV